MNLILFDENDLIAENEILLTGRRLEHLSKVLKPEAGKKLRVGMKNGLIGTGEVRELSADRVLLKTELTVTPPAPARLSVILALPRPKSLPRLVQTLSMLGIKDIHFIHSYKVAKDFWSSDYLSRETVEQAAVLGLEQAVDTVMPKIEFRRRFKPFVEDELPELMRERMGFVAHPYGAEPCPERVERDAVLAIGPEGGWIDYELKMLEERGFRRVQCASRVLKLETAVTVLVSRLASF